MLHFAAGVADCLLPTLSRSFSYPHFFSYKRLAAEETSRRFAGIIINVTFSDLSRHRQQLPQCKPTNCETRNMWPLTYYNIIVIMTYCVHLLVYIAAKKKLKCTLVQALRLCTGRTAHRGSRGIALLFLDHGTRRG